jgi:hypothetical protein
MNLHCAQQKRCFTAQGGALQADGSYRLGALSQLRCAANNRQHQCPADAIIFCPSPQKAGPSFERVHPRFARE